MAILETFPNKGGHTFTDADSPITNRDTVNLIDFDIDDDSINEKTDINPHRLTSAEFDEIVAGVPNGYNDMPVIIDERGTEYVVGKYIKADGTIKSIYKKTILGSNINFGEPLIRNVEQIVDFKCRRTPNGTDTTYYLISDPGAGGVASDTGGMYPRIVDDYATMSLWGGSFSGTIDWATFYYTKITD